MKKLIGFLFFLVFALILVGCEMEDVKTFDEDKEVMVDVEVWERTSGATYRVYPEYLEWISGTGVSKAGKDVTLSIDIPETSPYTFVGWYITNESLWKGSPESTETTYTFKADNGIYYIYARIEKNVVNMEAFCANGGKIDGYSLSGFDMEFPIGKKKTLTAIPYIGYNFDGWYVDNELFSTDESIDFVADENMKKIEVKFVIDPRLSNYNINSTDTSCTITDVIDKTIEEVTIPRMVTSIGYHAFSNCTDLEKIILPDRLESINSYAFSNCDKLTSIVLPRSIESIGSDIFYDCDMLTDVYYKGTLQNWFDVSLEYNSLSSHNLMFLDRNGIIEHEESKYTKYEGLIIPNGILSIGNYQFYGFRDITNVIIPIYVEEIGYCAFCNCYNLEKVYYKGTITEWEAINIDSSNNSLFNATIYYYSKTTPTSSGNYWHYDVNNEIEIWS